MLNELPSHGLVTMPLELVYAYAIFFTLLSSLGAPASADRSHSGRAVIQGRSVEGLLPAKPRGSQVAAEKPFTRAPLEFGDFSNFLLAFLLSSSLVWKPRVEMFYPRNIILGADWGSMVTPRVSNQRLLLRSPTLSFSSSAWRFHIDWKPTLHPESRYSHWVHTIGVNVDAGDPHHVGKAISLLLHFLCRNSWRKRLGWDPYPQTAGTNAMPAPLVKPYKFPHYQPTVGFIGLLRALPLPWQQQRQEQVRNTQITSPWDGNASVEIISSIHSLSWCVVCVL